ncbi:MAG TPA: amidohydrolase family protein [Gemmataceae bacterium]|jgi:L-fuconolactonase|nr:amidohydrolase family protein [Gemmataceae bacterium]
MTLTRREFLTVAAAAPALVADAAEPTPIIDTHTHFYDPTRPEGVPWPGKDDKLLYRPVLPGEFKKLVKPHGVTGTVVVEASPWPKDNDWLLALAKDEPFIKGIVGRLVIGQDDRADSADLFPKELEFYAKNPLFRGIRIAGADLAKGFDVFGIRGHLKLFIDAGLTLEINGSPEMLPDVAKLAKEFPKLAIVVNHMANVAIDGKEPPKDWQRDIAAVGKFVNVYCKMSALVEGTRKRDGTASKDIAFYRPTLDVLWNAFGEDRLVYGSNWPVSDAFASYATVIGLVNEYLASKGKSAVSKVMGGNATRVYGLDRTGR